MHLTQKQKRRSRNGTLALVIALAVVSLDLLKCTLICEATAYKLGATRTAIRRVTFDGLWRVTLDTDVPGSGGTVRYSVMPILPVLFR